MVGYDYRYHTGFSKTVGAQRGASRDMCVSATPSRGLHFDYPIAVEAAYYVVSPGPTLRAGLTASGTVLIAWPAPSPGFALQQNPNLSTTNWTSVTNIPQVVGGENQISVSPAATRNFYRLMQP